MECFLIFFTGAIALLLALVLLMSLLCKLELFLKKRKRHAEASYVPVNF